VEAWGTVPTTSIEDSIGVDFPSGLATGFWCWEGDCMGLFEEQPLLLVPLILAVVIAYDGAKWAIRRSVRFPWRNVTESSVRGR
jgi:hypothetical protein